ncbi:hypothetical protein WSM22_41630 [Cytophagales bacterium WSM2-2]|nr:hypothetical protein WSM22_41630 [Cytophagales bacterium WSM2-2]
MENEHLITIEEFCTHYNVEVSFVHSLIDVGLVEITVIDQTHYLLKDQISSVEKMIRLHYDLDINIAGIEAISHLLQRINSLHEELAALKSRFQS